MKAKPGQIPAGVPAAVCLPCNAALCAGFLLVQLLPLAVIPLVLLPRGPEWGWLLLLPVLLTNAWWALMHEALHGHLFPDRTVGRALGRVSAVLYGAAFDLLRAGHLLHHALSRTPRERSEVYRPGSENRAAAVAGYYFRLLGGLYLFEVLGSLLFLLPAPLIRRLGGRLAGPHNVVAALLARLLKPAALAAVRLDAAAVLVLHVAACAGYGHYWWMLALALWGRGLLISLMDNVFHYATPLGDPRYARNLALPRWAGRLILNFNLHGVHHQHAAVPWHALPAVHRTAGGGFQGGFGAAMLAQFHGPVPEAALPVRVPNA